MKVFVFWFLALSLAARADIHISIFEPSSTRADDALSVGVTVDSTFELKSVVAQVADRTTNLVNTYISSSMAIVAEAVVLKSSVAMTVS